MVWDSHYGMVLFRIGDVLEGRRFFDFSKDCRCYCGAMAFSVLDNGLLFPLFEHSFLTGSAVAYFFADRPSLVSTLDQGQCVTYEQVGLVS